MSSEIMIKASNIGKCYQIYERPNDRLIQGIYMLASRLSPFPKWRHKFKDWAEACAKQHWALHDVSFELRRGETFGIVGRNGSGKSTMLQILCGTLNPTQGEIEVNGRVAALLELGSGFNPDYTGRENIYMNGQLLGLSRNEVDKRIDDIIAFADIGDFIEQPVKTYSSGMFVRVAFAVIAHVDADILVIDEALSVGDVFFTQKCMRFLRNFMTNGTILFVSHDTAAVKSLCQRALWLDKGSMQMSGSAKAVSERYLQAFYETTTGLKNSAKTSALFPKILSIPGEKRDARRQWINNSNVRNDIEVFEFESTAHSFGSKDAKIISVNFFYEDGSPLTWIVGGEYVGLKIRTFAYREIHSPIIGFYIKDRLGQTLFGDNTYFTYHDTPLDIDSQAYLEAEFNFIMPILPKGDYSVCVAIASGSNDNHVPLEWIHDAMILRSESSHVGTGLIGIPMQKIELKIID